MSINTKEQLRTHIHKIHNLIRNSGAGYGLDALKIFNFFYGLKVLEPFWDEYELESARFSKLVEMAKKANTPEKELRIHDELFGNNLSEKNEKYKQGILYELNDNNELRKIIVSKINDALKTNFYKQIILEINKIPTVNNKQKTDVIGDKFDVDIKGKTYEYFIGRDKQAISDLGAYFSDRHFTNFAINIVKPESVDGKVPLYIDPFGGSGGFTISFVNYLKTKYPKLNWDKHDNIESINHYDMSEVVVKSCALEIFALTGQIPDMKENFQIGNSFKADFGGLKYKYIFSNPPFGGSVSIDTSSETHKLMGELKNRFYGKVEGDNGKEVYRWTEDWAESQYKELKDIHDYEISEIKEQQVNWDTCGRRIREYCVEYDEAINKKCRKENLKDCKELIKTFQIRDKCNDKESCSLVMFMELLDKDGTASIIIKEGVLFDSKYSSIRKCLIDNFNVSHIISIPQDAFENTTTKTSIIIFKNNGRTEKIRFSELVVEKEVNDVYEVITNGEGETRLELTAHRDQIKKVSDEVKAWATYVEISKSILKSTGKSQKVAWNYSLNYKDYLKDETFCPEGYKLVKLANIGEINRGKRIDTMLKITNEKTEENIYPVFGAGSIQGYTNTYNRDEDKCILCRVGSIKSKNCCKLINSKFYISDAAFTFDVKNEFEKYKTYIHTYMYENYDKIFTTKSSGSVQMTISSEVLKNILIPIPNDISKLKPQLTKLAKTHSKISDLTEQIPQKEKAICDLIKDLIDNGEEGKDWDEYKLGDICELKDGYNFYRNEMDERKKFVKGENLPLIKNNGGVITDFARINKKYDKYIATKGDLLIGTAGTCGRLIELSFDIGYHVHNMPRFMNIKINKKYLYYYLQNILNKQFIDDNSAGSVLGTLKMETIINIKIKVLKDKVLTKYKLQDKFDEVDKMKEELETIKKTYQEEIDKLMEPFKNNNEEEIDNLLNKSDNSSSKSVKSDKSVKSTKSIKTTEKKVLKTRKQVETNSDSDTNSDSETNNEDTQLEKLGISKLDLVQFKTLTKDECTHWFHNSTNKIFTNDKKGNWTKGKKQLYDVYKDEIEEIKKIWGTNVKKSSKSSKSKKNKEKKNKSTKSTKSNVVIVNSDSEVEKVVAKGQNISKYKSKAKTNSKYISESDTDEDKDELEVKK